MAVLPVDELDDAEAEEEASVEEAGALDSSLEVGAEAAEVLDPDDVEQLVPEPAEEVEPVDPDAPVDLVDVYRSLDKGKAPLPKK